jgi:hypothetical protein
VEEDFWNTRQIAFSTANGKSKTQRYNDILGEFLNS